MLRADAAYGGVTRTGTVCGIVAAVVAGSLWMLPAASAQGTDPPPPGLGELWDEYPLEPPETQPPAQPEAPVEKPASTPAPGPTEGNGSSVSWLAAGAAIGGCIVLLAAVGLVARARRRTAPATVLPEGPDELIAYAYALATEAAECDKYPHGQRHEGISVMTGTHDDDLSTSDASGPPALSSYAELGERVAGVLAAAETAATQIREDARASAEEILSLARDEAEALRRETAAYDADTRAAVESYASDRRREVDDEVQKQLADGELQARATRQAAEALARQIESDAKRRGQALRDESRVVEERLQKAAQGLRRMTAGIEELLGAPSGDGESLTDALRPYSQQPELPVTAARNDDR
jgi:cell division septum initiation protein DivIVA